MAAKQLEVQYSEARSGGIQFGDRVIVYSPEMFKKEVINLIGKYGAEDVFDFVIKDETGTVLVSQEHGLPDGVMEIVSAAFLGVVDSRV